MIPGAAIHGQWHHPHLLLRPLGAGEDDAMLRADQELGGPSFLHPFQGDATLEQGISEVIGGTQISSSIYRWIFDDKLI